MNAGRDQIELLFRARNGEWVFRAPNPWIIGNAQHYMVNNAQKEQIIGILTPQHPVRMGIYFSISILAWICLVAGVMLGFGFYSDEFGSPSVVVLSLMLVPVLLAVLAIPLQQKRRLHTILSGAFPAIRAHHRGPPIANPAIATISNRRQGVPWSAWKVAARPAKPRR